MWKSFIQNEDDPPVYLKVEVFEDNTIKTEAPEDRLRYNVSVTNYIKMWNGIYDNKRIITMMLESNKGTEADDQQEFLHAGLRMLHNPKLVDKKEFYETQRGNLCVRLLCKGPIVLKMNFTLEPCTAEHFYHSITRPLLVVINNQMSSESKLRQQLIKKDQEIKGFLDMLPEGSPLMRCLRTKEYNDQEHMETHGAGAAMAKLFGTDGEDNVCLQHIIMFGRPLPVLQPDETQIKKETSTNPRPSDVATSDALIKTKPVDGLPSSQGTHLDPITAQIPADQSEQNKDTGAPNKCTSRIDKGARDPNKGTSEPNDIKSEPNEDTSAPNKCTSRIDKGARDPNKGTSEPNDIKSEPNEDTSAPNKCTSRKDKGATDPNKDTSDIKSEPNNGNKQTSGANKVKKETCIPTENDPNEPTLPTVTQSEDLDPIRTKSEQHLNSQDSTEKRRSPEINPDVQRLQCTLKKRRKNLNY